MFLTCLLFNKHIYKTFGIWAYNNTTWGSEMKPYIQTQRIKFKSSYHGIHVDFRIASDDFLFNKFFELVRKYGKCTQKYLISEIRRRRLWEKYPELKPYFQIPLSNNAISGDTYTLEHIPSCFGNYNKCARCYCSKMLACMEASQI